MRAFHLFPMTLLLVIAQMAYAQAPWQQKQTELSIGVSIPFLYSGTELLQAQALRAAGQSYYQNPEGMRRSVGNYPNQIGSLLQMGYYLPTKIPGLMLGTKVNVALTGSQPAQGGYEEGYFFNYLQFNAVAKYYINAGERWFVMADAGLASVLTKNRFLNAAGQQEFFHQFGIGAGGGLGFGLTTAPFKKESLHLEIKAYYQQMSTRVEVNGIGDDAWNFGAANLMIGLHF
ncbi:MAG TPA: hypothetical protein PKC76_08255 [Saprospiraceae bacterium]|nr:hypothetical protein [Saprospiraceae bacterium]